MMPVYRANQGDCVDSYAFPGIQRLDFPQNRAIVRKVAVGEKIDNLGLLAESEFQCRDRIGRSTSDYILEKLHRLMLIYRACRGEFA